MIGFFIFRILVITLDWFLKVGHLLVRFFLVFLLFGVSEVCLSQQFTADDYVVTQYSLDEGLPQSSVNDIIQTKDGYIWLATYGGLVRFDGLTFTTFNRGNTPGMEWDRIMWLFEDPEGGIWMNTEQTDPNFYRFKDGKVEKYSFNENVLAFEQMYNSKGELWLSAFNKLYKFNGESFDEFPIIKPPSSSDLKTHIEDTKVLVRNRIISIRNKKAYEIFNIEDKIEGGIVETHESELYPKTLFIGTRIGRFYKFENNRISELDVEAGLKGHSFINFGNSNHSSRRIYAVIFERIGVLEGSIVKYHNPGISKKKLAFKSILEDKEGNIWMGTNANGLFKLQPTSIEMIDQDQGLTTESMLSLTQLNNGTALLSSNCGGLFEWIEGRANPSKIQDFFLSGCNWSVFQDSKNRIWIGGGGIYVTRSINEVGKFYGLEQGFTNSGVYAIMEDRKKNIWIGTGEGLYVFNGDSFSKKYTETEGLYHRDSRALFEDNSGKVWVGSNRGLNTIDNDTVKKVVLANDDKNTSSVAQPYVRAIYQDVEDNIWIGTYGDGLFRIKAGRIEQITVSDGLFDNVISHVVEDKYGYFWMGSNRGISRVNRSDLSDYLDGRSDSFSIASFGVNDGMNSAETNGGFQPSTFTDDKGKIYFPTVSGVAIVDPDKVSNNSFPPPVYIEKLRTEESEIPVTDFITLSYDNAFLEINYTGINFTDPEKVQFRYKMTGLNDDWIEVGNLRSAIYSKIPPGDYTFQVIAANSDGVWNTEGASFNINVIPPFWQKGWFIAILSGFILGAGFLFYRIRTNLLREENERQKRFTEQLIESEEQERNRIAAELHDGLGQQMMVIKNRAELAKNFIGDKETLEEQLDEIMESAVASISDVRSMSYGLRPVHLERFGLTEAIKNLLDEVKETTKIQWDFEIVNVDGVIVKNKEINFYRVLQEAINNILKHSEADKASVKIYSSDKEIKISINDNGIGFDADKKENLVGLGLSGMQERVETLSGKMDIFSSIGEGTQILVSIPKSV